MAEGTARAGTPDGLDGAGLRVGVVRARWNAAIVDRLAEGVARGLKSLGVAADAHHARAAGLQVLAQGHLAVVVVHEFQVGRDAFADAFDHVDAAHLVLELLA